MATFQKIDFNSLNEADIREEVIAPLLRALGYRSGTEFNIIREQSLRYPRIFIGRKDVRKDPELRGRADYILEVRERIRWVLEAKPPGAEIDVDDVEQAYSYANHSEVRAVYFVLCNGRRISVYLTQNAPTVAPVLSVKYEELEARYNELLNVLGPDSIEKDFPNIVPDGRPPLGPGLRSIARIASGLIRYQSSTLNYPILSQLQTSIQDGAVERDEAGCLIVYLKTQALTRSMQEFSEKMGLKGFEMNSKDSALSTDPLKPNLFTYALPLIFPEGSELLDIHTWNKIRLPTTFKCVTTANAKGYLDGNIFSGQFISSMQFQQPPAPTVQLEGDFFVKLA